MKKFIDKLNDWGRNQVPFLFVIDFELQSPMVFALDDIDPALVQYDFNGVSNANRNAQFSSPIFFRKFPVSLEDYRAKFDIVQHHLQYGDTFLTNLTVKTKIELSHSLMDLFAGCHASYKLCFRDNFLVFSPETFVKINNGTITSFPMKGTIDANIPDASNLILHDQKELAEHITIVDLIRNDLSAVSSNVRVSRFRYLEEIRTNQKNLLQVSSEIVGDLSPDYASHIGDILISLLPAGSVSGAPKAKTLDVIRKAELSDRQYFTGVCGLFDGQRLDSAVMIRFIEQKGNDFYYRSGGGITAVSDLEQEFQEAIDKVYIPTKEYPH